GRSTEIAVITDPTTKMPRHHSSTRCRATRSVRRPMRGSTATYPSRNPEMIGAARCRASTLTPTPRIMSCRASTTTYVSAAARATATDAVASRAFGPPRPPVPVPVPGLGRLDVNLLAIFGQRQRVAGVLGLREERPRHDRLAQ